MLRRDDAAAAAGREAREMDLFLAAVELPRDEWGDHLARACAGEPSLCGRVERLLRSHAAAEARERDLPAARTDPGPDPLLGRRLGRYRVRGLLGAGGMGAVYEAEQERPRRRVALKVLRPGASSPAALRRFEREAELLGRLRHPGIARIYEAGAEDLGYGPQPWLAMERIEGLGLGEHCAARDLGLRERLELVARVADAVEHAHRRGVVHRDLKPENVLVEADGSPVVLDFGIARLAAANPAPDSLLTRSGELLGTLPYMSPEQLRGEAARVDRRTDVYALGVIGYELLSGRHPHGVEGLALVQAARRIQEQEPVLLGQREPRLRGDVETIFRKALEREVDRRYPSAGELAADLRRFLRAEPIAARAPSRAYRWRTFARRHRGLVASLAAILGLLAAATAVTTALWLRARAERELAEQAVAVTGAVHRFLNEDLLAAAAPHALGPDATLLEALERADRRLSGRFPDRPEVEAAIRMTLGDMYRTLGRLEEAAAHFDGALEAFTARLGPGDRQTLICARGRAEVLRALGRLEEAEAAARAGWEAARRSLGAGDPETGAHSVALANALLDAGRFDEAEQLYRAALAGAGREAPGAHPARTGLAALYAERGRLGEAAELLAEIHALDRASLGREHPDALTSAHNLAVVYARLGRHGEAERLQTENLEIRRRTLGDTHPETLATVDNLASLQHRMGEPGRAEPLFREALAARLEALGEAHPDTVLTGSNLGVLLISLGRFDEAADVLRPAYRNAFAAFPPGHPRLGIVAHNYGRALLDGGDPAAAEEPLLAAQEELIATFGAEHEYARKNAANLETLYRELECRRGAAGPAAAAR